MNKEDIVAICLDVRKRKFERARADIVRCKKRVEQSELELLEAKANYEKFSSNAPQRQDQLFEEVRGKPLNYLELDTYFAELAELSVDKITLEETAASLENAVNTANLDLAKHMRTMQEIRKKYEKIKEAEQNIMSERYEKSLIDGDAHMDDIALTLSQSNFKQNT